MKISSGTSPTTTCWTLVYQRWFLGGMKKAIGIDEADRDGIVALGNTNLSIRKHCRQRPTQAEDKECHYAISDISCIPRVSGVLLALFPPGSLTNSIRAVWRCMEWGEVTIIKADFEAVELKKKYELDSGGRVTSPASAEDGGFMTGLVQVNTHKAKAPSAV